MPSLGIPLEVIRQWPEPNYTNPTERGFGFVATCVILYTLAAVVVGLRLYARFVKLRSAGIDDYLTALSMIPLLGLNICLALAMKVFNFDRHVWDIRPEDREGTRKIILPCLYLYILTITLTKLGVLFLYKRLQVKAMTSFIRWISWASIASVLAYMLVFTLLLTLGCKPFEAFWKRVDPLWLMRHQGKWTCVKEGTLYATHGTVGIVQDFITCTIPLLVIRNLQLTRQQKISLYCVFVFGYSLCFIGIARVLTHVRAWNSPTYDFTWLAQSTFYLTALEANLAIICASLPCLRVYFRCFDLQRFLRKFERKCAVETFKSRDEKLVTVLYRIDSAGAVHEWHPKCASVSEVSMYDGV